jgi:hypothetical protein
VTAVSRTVAVLSAACLSFAGLAFALPVPAAAAVAACTENGPWSGAVIVGLPAGDGAVDIAIDGGHVKLTEADLGVANPSGAFGAAVVQDVWLNNDRCMDLIVSAPGRNGATGSVYLILGSDEGYGHGVVHRITSPAGAGNSWGATLAYIDASAILAVGAPTTPLAPHASGAVWLYPIDQFTGAQGTPAIVTQSSNGVPGTSETGDRFGAALAARWRTLVIGTPGEAVGSRKAAGAVTVLFMDGDGLTYKALNVTQNSTGVATAAESGDQFGAAVATNANDVAIGAPGESIGSATRTGSVSVVNLTGDERTRRVAHVYNFTQASPGVPGTNESGDGWGAALAFGGTFCNELESVLAVGAPLEDVGSAKNSGSVAIFGPVKHLQKACAASLYPGSGFVDGVATVGDHFGWSVRGGLSDPDATTLWDYPFLIGVPGHDTTGLADAGIVDEVLVGDRKTTVHEPLGGPVAGQMFGTVLGD